MGRAEQILVISMRRGAGSLPSNEAVAHFNTCFLLSLFGWVYYRICVCICIFHVHGAVAAS